MIKEQTKEWGHEAEGIISICKTLSKINMAKY